MSTTTKTVLALKQKAHPLKPVVMIGQHGLTDNVLTEIDIALNAHELIKIKIAAGEKEVRQELADTICAKLGALFVQLIGRVLVIYRKKPESLSPPPTSRK